MKFYFLKFICLFCVVVALSACLSDDETTVTSSTNPRMTAFTLAGNDSIKTAVFTLNADSVTVENVDSLPYGTPVNKAIPNFTFVSTHGVVYYLNGSSTAKSLTGKDTIDFSWPVKIKNTAADNIAVKEYIIKVNVHKVEPKLYVWTKLSDKALGFTPTSQKAVYFNNKIYYYANDGTTIRLYTSTDGVAWASVSNLNGLPTSASMENTQQFNGKLYYTQNGDKIYSSTDGIIWTVADYTHNNYTFKSIMFALNGKLWAIAQDKVVDPNSSEKPKYHFASSVDGSVWLIKSEELDTNFPVSEYSAVSFLTRVGSRPRAIVIGGKNAAGLVLKTKWSTEDGDYWVNFNENSAYNETLDSMRLGSTIISYDKKLLIFGTRNDTYTQVNHYKVSLDEGLSWKTPNSTYNKLPDGVLKNYSSVVVTDDGSNRIYIIGGSFAGSTFSDVWTGKLNSLSFIRQ